MTFTCILERYIQSICRSFIVKFKGVILKIMICEIKNLDEKDIDTLKNSSCLLSISVGQQFHEGDYFTSTIDLINNTFASCTISLYDSLQRYTMALNDPRDLNELHILANKEGDLWLKRNEKIYDKLKKLTAIVRWDDWIKKVEFEGKRKELLHLISHDISYKNHFDTAITKYLQRYNKDLTQDGGLELERVYNLCFNYVVEECAVLRLWPSLNCQFEVYPNLHNEAIEETRKRFVHSIDNSLLRLLTLKFKNGKQIGKQRFIVLESTDHGISPVN